MVTRSLETHIRTNMLQGKLPAMPKQVAANMTARLSDIAAQNAAQLRAKHKHVNLALIGSHIAVVIGIVGIIGISYRAPVEASAQTSRAYGVLDQAAPSVDQIVAADVATTVAQLANLPVESNVQSLSITLAAKTDLAQTDTSYLTKPQIVQQDTGRPPITKYTTEQGNTVQTVAAKFGISEDTVRWANNLTSDALPAGKDLTIAGTTGVVYTVKAGDDVAKLAEKYKADQDRIINYNDLELSGIVAGKQIVIPDGIVPDTERPGYRAPTRAASGYRTYGATRYAGNLYAFGYCTYYAYNRRAELGRPIGSNWGNASSWKGYAEAAGFKVDRTPQPGAVFQTAAGWGGAGHVGIVERVNADGSFVTTEMNYGGWNKIGSRTISAGEVGQYWYIH